jgi:predicted DNA binding CopG/RHH family protein
MEIDMSDEKFVKDSEDWDSGKFGTSLEHAKLASQETERAVFEKLGLQMISVRLQQSLIEDLKFIAKAHGVGYQPLIRDILTRFAKSEKRRLMMEIIEQKRLEMELDKNPETIDPCPDYEEIKRVA